MPTMTKSRIRSKWRIQMAYPLELEEPIKVKLLFSVDNTFCCDIALDLNNIIPMVRPLKCFSGLSRSRT